MIGYSKEFPVLFIMVELVQLRLVLQLVNQQLLFHFLEINLL